MGYFPIFVDIKDKNILIIGGGKVALRKTKSLLQYDANIILVSPIILEEFNTLKVTIKKREFSIVDLENVFLVICATNDIQLNQKILDICKEKNILCNSATTTTDNGYLFPAIVKQEDISIGISTSGKSPYISSIIKSDIEKELIPKYANLIEISNIWRNQLSKEISNSKDRGEIIKYLIDYTLKEDIPSREKIQQIIEKYR